MAATPHFLDEYVKELDDPSFPENRQMGTPWYNAEGDCIIYIGVEEETVADRIDEYLTLYRSIETELPVGFQIKGVLGLIREFGLSAVNISATLENKEVTSVSMETGSHSPLRYSLTELILAAFEKPQTQSIRRREGYSAALRSRTDAEEIALT